MNLKMLGVFGEAVARGPEALMASPGAPRCTSEELVAKFRANSRQPISVAFRGSTMVYNTHQHPPRAFAASDDIFCIFEGALRNLSLLRQQYGLSKSVNEALLVIEAYRALRDRAPFPPDQVVGDLEGDFAFIIYDNHTHKIFVASDSSGKVPLYWGTTSDAAVAFSNDETLIRETCGKSFAIFPQGCYFSSDEGLRSFEHPLKEVTAVPRVDSDGQTYGSTFKVDFQRTLSRSPRPTNRLRPWGVV